MSGSLTTTGVAVAALTRHLERPVKLCIGVPLVRDGVYCRRVERNLAGPTEGDDVNETEGPQTIKEAMALIEAEHARRMQRFEGPSEREQAAALLAQALANNPVNRALVAEAYRLLAGLPEPKDQ